VASYVYVGDEGRVYPSLPAPANSPENGVSYTLHRDPGDGRWELVDKPDSKPDKPVPLGKPTTDPAPAGDTKE
jgi:hypothetical protein